MAMRQWWHGVILGTLLLSTGSVWGAAMTPQAFAQPTTVSSQGRSLLAELWLLNQGFVSLRPGLENLPDELAAISAGTIDFEPQLFRNYRASLQQLQTQGQLLEAQLGIVEDPTQREALATAIANLNNHLDNLINLVEPFEDGFNPETIRSLQEFLDFFERHNLGETDYGFYGSVTQTELEEYLDRQLNDLSTTLKTLNETATQGAIAPDLATSIEYLYTSLSLENTVLNEGETFQALIQRLQRDNQRLKGRLRNSNFLLGLLLLLTTASLTFLYTQKSPKAPHPGHRYFPDVDPEPADPVDLGQLEKAITKRLQRRYILTPKATFVEEATPIKTNLPQAALPEESEIGQMSTALPNPTISSPPEPSNSTETISIDDTEFDFPVQFLNPYDALVDTYNSDANTFAHEAIALAVENAAPQDTESEAEENFFAALSFATNDQGEYWAIQVQSQYYLVPRANLKITPQNYGIFQQVFVCYGAQKETPQSIKLLKPARLAKTDQENSWELVQPGIVVLKKLEADTK